MSKFSEFRLAFVDTETTGLDKNIHEIIEIAALIYDPVEKRVIGEWEKKIFPRNIETASPEALKINGYYDNPGSYKADAKSAMIKFNSITRDCMIVGQNIDFDIGFIKKTMAEFNIAPNFDRHRKLDTQSLAWFAVKESDIQKLSLAGLCDHFGVSNINEHRALADCRRAFGVYKCLEEIYLKSQ